MASVIQTEARRTHPDFVVYVPGEDTGVGTHVDQHNMHLIVTPVPGGDFLATWTQASVPHGPDQRIVLARSSDRGRTWSEPVVIDAPEPGAENIASWSVLVCAPQTGRIYCLYHKNAGVVDYDRAMTGVLAWRCSEDGGATWGERFETPIGRGAIDHPDAAVPSNWVMSGWQRPIVTQAGEVICPITRWASRAQGFLESFAEQEHEGWFLRFDNIRTEPDPSKLAVTTLPEGDRGIRLPNPIRPGYSAAMEPAICGLSDGRIMCLIRTMTGSLCYSVSANGARSWSVPQELCFAPGGRPVLHPNAPVTFAAPRDGRYVLLFHNNDGTANGGEGPQDSKGRRPVFLSVGREIDNPGGQPLAFDSPRELYDNGGPSRPYSGSLALYGTFFEYEGQRYLWYADAMRFLLGRLIPDELLDAPGAGWAPSLNLPRGGPS